MEEEIILKIKPYWKREHTDLSECNGCTEIIYSDMWRLVIREIKGTIKMTLCDSCYSVLINHG